MSLLTRLRSLGTRRTRPAPAARRLCLQPLEDRAVPSTVVDQLTAIVRQIHAASEAIGEAAAELSAGNADLSRRTESQAKGLEATAASMRQMTAAVHRNAEAARQADTLAAGAAAVAAEGREAVGRVVATMRGIERDSRRIAELPILATPSASAEDVMGRSTDTSKRGPWSGAPSEKARA